MFSHAVSTWATYYESADRWPGRVGFFTALAGYLARETSSLCFLDAVACGSGHDEDMLSWVPNWSREVSKPAYDFMARVKGDQAPDMFNITDIGGTLRIVGRSRAIKRILRLDDLHLLESSWWQGAFNKIMALSRIVKAIFPNSSSKLIKEKWLRVVRLKIFTSYLDSGMEQLRAENTTMMYTHDAMAEAMGYLRLFCIHLRLMLSYEPLPSDRHIRLIRLSSGALDDPVHLRLVPTSLDSSPTFEALSYAWGDVTSDPKVVHCDEALLQVGQNLHSALVHLRHQTETRVLWADAICINQKDDEERGQQIQIMADIYSAATRTLIWLGKETSDTIRAVAAIQRFHDESHIGWAVFAGDAATPQYYGLLEALFGSRHAMEVKQIGQLLCRSWFGRKWIVQEVLRSADPQLVLGTQTLPWNLLENFVYYLVVYKVEHYLCGPRLNPTIMSHLRNVAMLLSGRLTRDDPQGSTLLDQVIKYCSFECRDQRDHIIALIGIAADVSSQEMAMFANYVQPSSETFYRFARWCILNNRCLKIFSLKTWIPVGTSAIPCGHLPSWAPDIANLSLSKAYGRPLHYEPRGFCASGDSQLSATLSDDGLLALKGSIVDSISVMGTQEIVSAHDEPPHLDASTNWVVEACRRLLLFLDELESIGGGADAAEPADQGRPSRFGFFKKALGLRPREPQGPQLSERRVDFLRTVLGDCRCELATKELQAFETYMKLFRQCQQMRNHESLPQIQQKVLEASPKWDSRLQNFGYRRFCRSEKGRFGWVPRYAMRGDTICVFEGGMTPHVIRRERNGRYKLVGDCYVQGLMLGEAMLSTGSTIVLE
ncbi:heterokaryon incompatibility protein-domain-containing protein [Dactylonectria macrodidyma]|uniref:Heterokaryon incompatibility protein-domain-containing protein n=1 Tax=Dactylonectria macrodidyma TaxID=307937 RepID=A0A9P9FIR5_9HYPO|nr:heterokaryon incompatibility protein-domain-containing protein [Dactylonectria macrodidyma]